MEPQNANGHERRWCPGAIRRAGLLLAATLLVFGLAGDAWAQIRTRDFASGFSAPVAFVQDPIDRSVQLVVEQFGRIRVIRNGVVLPTDFLDLRSAVAAGGERGLLGLAFAPDSGSGRFFVNFTNTAGHSVIARFRRSLNPLVADPGSRVDLRWGGAGGSAFIEQPFPNHNGGHLAFGPDGFLYIGLGDGGSGSDPDNRAQNPSELLGKMLRIDINVPDGHAIGYHVPPGNPFVGSAGTRPEIWSFGLRNPWRYSFDDPMRGGTGALLLGDVGQGQWEEIDYEPPNRGGRNYGWRYREGAHDHVTSIPPASLPLVDPVHEYSHGVGRSVTGGYVYRGRALGGAFRGRYFFADFISGRVWSIALIVNQSTGEATATGLVDHTAELGGTRLGNVSSFGVDADRELYIVNYSAGTILKVLGPGRSDDLDADGRSDITVYRPSNGHWFTRQSHSDYVVHDHLDFQWGLAGDVPVPGDYDRDGQTDLAVYRSSSGEWFIRYSTTGYATDPIGLFQWGLPGDLPIVADFDGDGQTDLTVYRPATGQWFIRFSSQIYSTATYGLFQWGLQGDTPLATDFDGDGKTDLTVYRPSTGQWFLRFSSQSYNTGTFGLFQWGLPGDMPLVGDFDADARTELTVYRPTTGEWFIRHSTENYNPGTFRLYQWGLANDIPMVADFEGDGKTDLTVYRPTTGQWFIRYSSQNYSTATYGLFQWGLDGDQPLPKQ